MYDRKALECRNQVTALECRIEEIRAGAPAPVQGAIDLMELASRAADLFAVQPPQEKQAFLRLVLKSAAWRHGELQTQFEEPFENLRRSNQLSRRKDTDIVEGNTPNLRRSRKTGSSALSVQIKVPLRGRAGRVPAADGSQRAHTFVA